MCEPVSLILLSLIKTGGTMLTLLAQGGGHLSFLIDTQKKPQKTFDLKEPTMILYLHCVRVPSFQQFLKENDI
jgi:hypothetical protein